MILLRIWLMRWKKTYIKILIQFFLEEFQSIAPKISQSLILMIIFMMDLITYNDIYYYNYKVCPLFKKWREMNRFWHQHFLILFQMLNWLLTLTIENRELPVIQILRKKRPNFNGRPTIDIRKVKNTSTVYLMPFKEIREHST